MNPHSRPISDDDDWDGSTSFRANEGCVVFRLSDEPEEVTDCSIRQPVRVITGQAAIHQVSGQSCPAIAGTKQFSMGRIVAVTRGGDFKRIAINQTVTANAYQEAVPANTKGTVTEIHDPDKCPTAKIFQVNFSGYGTLAMSFGDLA